MEFNIYNSIILAGILQGFVFGIVVLSNKKYRATSTVLLALLMLSFSMDNFQYQLVDIGLISELDLLQYYFVPVLLFSGPLFLLYGKHMLNSERKLSKKDIAYFVPFIVTFAVACVYKGMAITGNLDHEAELSLYDFEYILEVIAIFYDAAVIMYLMVSVELFSKQKNQPRAIRPEVKWFRGVLLMLLALVLIWLVIIIADYGYDEQYWYGIYIGMAIVTYYMGYAGIYKYGVFEERKKIRNFSVATSPVISAEKRTSDHIAKMKDLLCNQKRFLDPTLSLEQTAAEIGVSKSHLSRLINSELETGFNNYLNSLRVEEAKRYLEEPEFAHYTLVAIGLEAGFNSKTTFNTAFRKLTGVTPSEYRKSVGKS